MLEYLQFKLKLFKIPIYRTEIDRTRIRTHIRLCLTRYKIYRGQCPYPRSTTRVTRVYRVVHGLKDGTRTCTGCRSIRGRDDRNGAVQTRTIPHLNSIPTS